ncbi:PTS transporter subunit IIC, partial [Enterococcus faecalis]|uniref:PTS transporter subunit IIC n=1 Tax=Enterococcus faecalis TaxID=1351 RepID=UPI003CC544C1
MNTIIDLANTILKPLIDLGAAPLMTIVLTLIALSFKVKPTRAIHGGLKLGIAYTGISDIIVFLTTALSDAMASFVERTGISLNITDVG